MINMAENQKVENLQTEQSETEYDLLRKLISKHYENLSVEIEKSPKVTQEDQISNLLDDQIEYMKGLKELYSEKQTQKASPLEQVKETLSQAKERFQERLRAIPEGLTRIKESPKRFKEMLQEKTLLAVQKTLSYVQDSAERMQEKLDQNVNLSAEQNAEHEQIDGATEIKNESNQVAEDTELKQNETEHKKEEKESQGYYQVSGNDININSHNNYHISSQSFTR